MRGPTARRRSATRRTAAAATAALLLALTGCGSGSDAASGESPTTTAVPTRPVLTRPVPMHAGGDGLRVHVFTSMPEMDTASQAVLVGTVTGSAPSRLMGMRDFTVDVDRTARGELPETIVVRDSENGIRSAEGDAQDDLYSFVEEGRTYLLYLVGTQLDEDPAHTYYLAGGSGALVVDGDHAWRTDPESDRLPEHVRVDEMLAAAEAGTFQRPTWWPAPAATIPSG